MTLKGPSQGESDSEALYLVKEMSWAIGYYKTSTGYKHTANPIAQSDLTLGDLDSQSPDYLDIKWKGSVGYTFVSGVLL